MKPLVAQTPVTPSAAVFRTARANAPAQRGYALVALLALMTLLMIATMAAVPSLRQQNQRELELEAIARGEEVAEAIRLYVSYSGRLPTSMDELMEGAPFGTKKIQVLRASAAHDPLSTSGEWRLVKANDPAFIEFAKSLALYNNNRLPETRDNKLKAMVPVPQFTAILDTKTKEEAPGGEDTSTTSNGPFIGVVSRNRRESVLTYYDIDRHDKWIFTPMFR